MSSQAAKPLSPQVAATLQRNRFKPGQSGNPGGRSKQLLELQALTRDNFPLANKRLADLLASENMEDVKWAIAFTFTYTLGKPWEGRDLLHLDSMLAKKMELLVESREIPETPAQSLPGPAPVVVRTQETVSETKEVILPPVVVVPEAAGDRVIPEAASIASVPSGLRCLYRDKSGQCEALAADGVQWCNPHRQKLFEAIT